jgi:hypothetical protein
MRPALLAIVAFASACGDPAEESPDAAGPLTCDSPPADLWPADSSYLGDYFEVAGTFLDGYGGNAVQACTSELPTTAGSTLWRVYAQHPSIGSPALSFDDQSTGRSGLLSAGLGECGVVEAESVENRWIDTVNLHLVEAGDGTLSRLVREGTVEWTITSSSRAHCEARLRLTYNPPG